MSQHANDWPLSPVYYLRYAIEVTDELLQPSPPSDVEKIHATQLLQALDHFANLPTWDSVTLRDVAERATLMDSPENRERWKPSCICDAWQLLGSWGRTAPLMLPAIWSSSRSIRSTRQPPLTAGAGRVTCGSRSTTVPHPTDTKPRERSRCPRCRQLPAAHRQHHRHRSARARRLQRPTAHPAPLLWGSGLFEVIPLPQDQIRRCRWLRILPGGGGAASRGSCASRRPVRSYARIASP